MCDTKAFGNGAGERPGDPGQPMSPIEGSASATNEDRERRNIRLAFLNREAAEVYLLLDFLSGRSDRSLRPTQEEQARSLLEKRNNPPPPETPEEKQRTEVEEDLSDPTRLVLRAMRIQYPLNQ